MTWSYSLSTLATTPKDQIRRLIGDVIQTEQQIADEEILFALTQRSSIYGAAADCCTYIAAQFSRKTDTVVAAGGGGNLKQNYSQQARSYMAMAARFETLSVARGGAVPYAGGVSVSDKQNNENDTDRVAPQFNIGMMDDLLPVGPVGNETPGDVPSDGGS